MNTEKEKGFCSICGLEVEYPDNYVKKCNCGRLLHTDHTTRCPHIDYKVWISAIKE